MTTTIGKNVDDPTTIVRDVVVLRLSDRYTSPEIVDLAGADQPYSCKQSRTSKNKIKATELLDKQIAQI